LPATDLVLILIDGLTPAALRRVVEQGRAPALAYLLEHGTYTEAVSAFPSLTPVAMSSVVTGASPDRHGIPHLVWYHRGERRLVEYGSSLSAVLAAGTRRVLADTIFNLNDRHLAPDAETVFESLERAGLETAAVNVTCYRGGTRHRPTVPGVGRPAFGPRRFFFYSLFESDETGAPLAVRHRSAGSVDGYAAAVGRWLVTRDGFDFLFYYLSDYDYASHARGPGGADEWLVRSDAAVEALFEAAGGRDEFLERYVVLLASDHGQTAVREVARVEERLRGLDLFLPGRRRGDVAVCASNRAAQLYRLDGCRETARQLAQRFDRDRAVDVAAFLEDGRAVARRGGEDVPLEQLPHPRAKERLLAALANPNGGEVLLSAAEGWEFADLGGGHHRGGGSHGSLVAGDSLVPVVSVGVDARPRSITELTPAVLRHFGVERLSRAA
jgi:hypothetical protein